MKDFVNRHIRWIFPLPVVLFIIIMMAFPVVFTGFISLTGWTSTTIGIPKFIGLKNYIDTLREPRFYNSLLVTVYLWVLAVGVETILGVAIALLLNRNFIGKGIVKTLLLLPMVSTPVAVGLCWTLFYQPTVGLLNYVLKQFGLPVIAWLATPSTVIPAIALVDIWEWTPFITLIVLGGLAGLPSDCFEAAEVDGANGWKRLWYVTLPLLMPTILTAVMLRSIDAIKTFDIIFSMTNGGPLYSSENLNIYAYKEAFQYFQFGKSSSLLILLFILVLGCTGLIMKIRTKAREVENGKNV